MALIPPHQPCISKKKLVVQVSKRETLDGNQTLLFCSAKIIIYRTNKIIHFFLIELCTRNPKLKRELVECQLESKSPFPLSAHIVLPFQRLLKYHLMLGRTMWHLRPRGSSEHVAAQTT